MIKKYFKIILLVWLVVIIIMPQLVSAENKALDKLQIIGQGNGAPFQEATEISMFNIISTIISAVLSLLGVIFLILIIYAGYMWMMARGDEKTVNKAKDTLTRAIVGIIIVVGAYAISYFVMSKLESGTLNGGSGITQTSAAPTVSPPR